MADQRSRGEASVDEAPGILEGQQTCSDKYLAMLHINIRGYLSHIVEATAALRGMVEKPILATMNETFLSKAIKHV